MTFSFFTVTDDVEDGVFLAFLFGVEFDTLVGVDATDFALDGVSFFTTTGLFETGFCGT